MKVLSAITILEILSLAFGTWIVRRSGKLQESILTNGARTHANSGSMRIIRFCTETAKVELLVMKLFKMVVVVSNQENNRTTPLPRLLGDAQI